jgi:hypothetical protein
MTDKRTFTKKSLPEVLPSNKKSDRDSAADSLIRFMREGADLVDLIPERLIEPVEGVTSAYDPGLMEKVALAIDHENGLAEAGSRDPDIRKALRKAGVSPEIYLQMSTDPDFKAVCDRVYQGFVVIPRWASICRAMTKSAMGGDVAAARWVRDMMESGDATIEAQMKSLEASGPEAIKQQVAQLQLQLKEMSDSLRQQETPVDLIEDAIQEMRESAVVEEAVSKIDLREMTE